MPEEVYSIEEVAKKLKVHKDTVRRMIRRRELPAFKMGRQWRIRKDVIERIMQENN